MSNMETKWYQELFAILSGNIDVFIQEVKNKQLNLMATDEWTVKDVLCHIVFWHENYAANYRALAANEAPPLFDAPGYRLNKEGVAALHKFSRDTLIKRLLKAQKSLYNCIVEKKVPQMTYKKNGHVYKTEDFLRVIARHILTHTQQVKRAR
jgi:hypothetical protein